ncbi:MAG TPA: hypothetical protein VGG06_20325 [Thermoanaerobaculia bacterium]
MSRTSLLFRILPAAFGALTLAAISAAQDEGCGDCHDVTLAAESVHADLGCLGCHMELDEELHPEEMTADEELCGLCHDAADALAASVHAAASCQDCHGPVHEIPAAAHPASPVSPLRQIASCGGCHDEHDLIDGYLTSVHGHALFKSGLVGAPSCARCHGAHDVLPPGDPRSTVSYQHAPETCGECHRFILDDWRELSAHGLRWQRGESGAPTCVTCHGSHEGRESGRAIRRPTERAVRLGFPESCGDCHSGPYGTYRDSFHGKFTDLGFVPSAICSDCHTPHKNLPAGDPRSSVHPDALAATCGQCHGEVSAGFLSFDPHSDPRDPERSRAVYSVWLFMTTLLIAVFAFFGLHDLLWLQRLLVGWRRGEWTHLRKKIGRGQDEPWVRRFPRIHVWTHAVIIVTFLVLAATGLPLKFHYAAWAQALTAMPGTVALLRLLHRAAAALTFGYAFLHLGFIVYRGLVRGDAGLFWGWRSLVPNARDLRDLWHNLRYFLYREPTLKLDRWSYWEKFDYFAVFWGVPIIGGSGLVLWFPDFFTRVLPGWALNAAYVIHSDEALLATGFIFVFHFFHTHLRPEIFPFDPVIFTGSMPLSRFREERRLEYERLQASGELAWRLVKAPGEKRLQVLFGRAIVAVTVGVLLAVAIFWSLFHY